MANPLYRQIAEDLRAQIRILENSIRASDCRPRVSCRTATGRHETRSAMRSNGLPPLEWSRRVPAREPSLSGRSTRSSPSLPMVPSMAASRKTPVTAQT